MFLFSMFIMYNAVKVHIVIDTKTCKIGCFAVYLSGKFLLEMRNVLFSTVL